VGDGAERKQLEQALQGNRSRLDRLILQYESTIAATEDRRQFDVFKSTLGAYRATRDALLRAIADQGDSPELIARLKSQVYPAFSTALTAVKTVIDWNKSHADDAVRQTYEAVAGAKLELLVSFVAALVLAIVCGYYLLRAITHPLKRLLAAMDVMRQGDFTQRMPVERRDEFGALAEGFNRMAADIMALVGGVQKSGIQVNTSMTEIAATSKQQQATAGEIAATTTQIGATSKEISATSKELLKTMNEVSDVAERTADLAGSGQNGLSHMEETMHRVVDAAGSINAKLAVLNEKAGNINQVVTTITKVADQTNLLSLNAAIEAEKAGEYGRGFAVVAAEIRRLADQTAVATYDIEQIVKEIQSAISAGVMGMDKFSEEVRHGMQNVQEVGGQLTQIIHQVQALVPRFETVNEGMQVQATGAEQISEALLQLTDAAKQTVDSLRQSTSAIEELNNVSGSLRNSVSRFKLEA
jgi:methyl-accepting chemotaxis protein WspA